MADELSIKVPSNVEKGLTELAKRHRLTTEKMVSVLLESFIDGGNIFTGTWPEGPGIRLLVDWPRFSARVFKIKNEDLGQS